MPDESLPAQRDRLNNRRALLIGGAICVLLLGSIATCLLAVLLGDPLPTYQDPPPALAQRAVEAGRVFEWLIGVSVLLLAGAIVASIFLVAVVARGGQRRRRD